MPAMQETQEIRVQFLGQEDPVATHFSIIACRIPQTEESGGLQSLESQIVGHN